MRKLWLWQIAAVKGDVRSEKGKVRRNEENPFPLENEVGGLKVERVFECSIVLVKRKPSATE